MNDCGVSDEDYDHVKKVWKEFDVKNMGEYHDLYLKSDVLLLADVFEEFRNVCMESYSLDRSCLVLYFSGIILDYHETFKDNPGIIERCSHAFDV